MCLQAANSGLAGVAHGVEQDRQGLHGLRLRDPASVKLQPQGLPRKRWWPRRPFLTNAAPAHLLQLTSTTLPSRSRGGTLISGRRSMGKCLRIITKTLVTAHPRCSQGVALVGEIRTVDGVWRRWFQVGMTPPPDLSRLTEAEKDALILALWARVAELEVRLSGPPKTPGNSDPAAVQGPQGEPAGEGAAGQARRRRPASRARGRRRGVPARRRSWPAAAPGGRRTRRGTHAASGRSCPGADPASDLGQGIGASHEKEPPAGQAGCTPCTGAIEQGNFDLRAALARGPVALLMSCRGLTAASRVAGLGLVALQPWTPRSSRGVTGER